MVKVEADVSDAKEGENDEGARTPDDLPALRDLMKKQESVSIAHVMSYRRR